MKKLLSFFAILMMAMTAWAIEPEQPTSGNGQSGSPYQIGSAANLVWFAQQVNGGQTDICGTLTANIDLGDDQTMIGTISRKYAGTFDGDGHSITVNYNITSVCVALFPYAEGATIQNLTTAGSITSQSSSSTAAGIVAYCDGAMTINKCRSSIAISNTKGDGTIAGILGWSDDSANLNDVLFDGKLTCSGKVYCYGMALGYNVHVNNCLFMPEQLSCTSSNTSYTLVHGLDVSINNCYYTSSLSTAQGTEVTSEGVASGEVCYLLNNGATNGTQAWYQNLDNSQTKDIIPVFDKTHGTVYGGADQCGTYSNTQKAHTACESFDSDGIKVCSTCSYIEYQQPGKDAEGAYLLANKGNLIWFANEVNAGATNINAKLTADIDLGNDQTMIGTEKNRYKGTFDGDGHTVTVNYSVEFYDISGNYRALFRYVNGATIQNLTTAGKITTGYDGAAGIVANNGGASLTISNCRSSIAITEGDGMNFEGRNHGGIVAYSQGNVTLNNVAFVGKLIEDEKGEGALWGGLICKAEGYAYINSCLFMPAEIVIASTLLSYTLAKSTKGVVVSNSFYTQALDQDRTSGVEATTAMLASGEVCYKLNDGKTDGTQAWYQNLDNGGSVDAAPVLRQSSAQLPENTHGTVYGGADQCGTYSNTQKAHTGGDTFDTDGLKTCTACHNAVYQQPKKDAAGTYLIANKGNLIWFAQDVNEGHTNLNAKLTSDIDLGTDQTMIGTSTYNYAGTFDGDGHSVTVNYTTSEDYTALFRHVNGATILNLTTTGSITTTAMFAAGIVSHSGGVLTISKCKSSIVLTSNASTLNGCHSGIVATSDGNVTLTNVVFDGKLIGKYGFTGFYGGMVGVAGVLNYNSEVAAHIDGCLFIPKEVPSASTVGTTFVRASSYKNEFVTNSYYTLTLGGEAQGTLVTAADLASGKVCYLLNKGEDDGSQAWYQNLDNGGAVDAAPVLDNTHGTVIYAGSNYCPTESYSNGRNYHNFGDYDYDADGLAHCTRTGCTGVDYQPAKKESSNTYLIANKGNLIWFAHQVVAGQTHICGRLLADIDLGDDQTMIGTSSNYYQGVFNGEGHSITVHYVATEDNTALFRYVSNAIIKNLQTAGSISTGYQFAGGIVAESHGSTRISQCASSVAITSTFNASSDGTHGGIVANNQQVINLENVLFNGQLLGSNATSCGGLVGWSKTSANLTNCLFYPSAPVTFSTSESKTLSRGNNVSAENCYYVTAFGEAQGTQASESAVKDGTLVSALGGNVWMQDPVQSTPVPFLVTKYLNKYFKLTAQADGEITIKQEGTVTATLKYMKEGTTGWTDVTYGTPISLNKDQSIWLCANGVNGKNEGMNTWNNYLQFTSTMDVEASQNIMSLLDASCEQTEVPDYAFEMLFKNWTHLTKAPELPATVLGKQCYQQMFYGCTSLTSIPDLSHATLAAGNPISACAQMFKNCSRLRVNTIGMGTPWTVQIADNRTDNNTFYEMFMGTDGIFKYQGTPKSGVTYYIYDDEPYTRSMANEWGTIVLPFTVAYDAENTNHKLYKLSDASVSENEGTLTFTEYETGNIAVGTPMVVKAIGEKGEDGKYAISIPSAKDGSFTETSKTLTNKNASLPEGWTMKGTFTNLENQTGIYFIAQNQFWSADSPITIAPFRAWFTGPEPANNVKAFSIVVDDEATDIGEIDGTSYMVNGTSGKFLENGKVVIVRNGRKYNTLGTTVR